MTVLGLLVVCIIVAFCLLIAWKATRHSSNAGIDPADVKEQFEVVSLAYSEVVKAQKEGKFLLTQEEWLFLRESYIELRKAYVNAYLSDGVPPDWNERFAMAPDRK